jgi:small subunit ribosomal protein S20
MLSLLKTIIKEADAAIKAKDVAKSLETLRIAESTLKRAASRGIIHKRTASRSVSRLSKKVYELTKKPLNSAEV